MLKAAAFIENRLTEEIRLADVARETGFSKYHLLRIFKAVSGGTVYDYIVKRRMTSAARDLIKCRDPILDIAITYGYDSQEAFTRIFKTVYGVTPSVYRRRGIHLVNLDKVNLTQRLPQIKGDEESMKPSIVERGEFTLVGLKYQGKNENNDIPKLWNEFMPMMPEIRHRVDGSTCYGFETYSEESRETGEFIYIAAIEVNGLGDIPAGLVVQHVPANKYAVFAIPAIIEDIPKAFCEIYGKWLPEAGLTPVGEYDFEFYDEDFVANSAASRLYIYIPVK